MHGERGKYSERGKFGGRGKYGERGKYDKIEAWQEARCEKREACRSFWEREKIKFHFRFICILT